MAANALVQTRIDPEIRDRASKVLERSGLTVSDAVRILLTRTANEGSLPIELLTPADEYDAWFRAKVQEALDDPRPGIPGDVVEDYFARRRAGLKPKTPWDNED
jgi:DNA-damage-inducible protein J